MCDKYAAHRALNQLDAQRAAGDCGDTARLPALQPIPLDDTVPELPALLRPQAE